jgi:hypothetical protein
VAEQPSHGEMCLAGIGRAKHGAHAGRKQSLADSEGRTRHMDDDSARLPQMQGLERPPFL